MNCPLPNASPALKISVVLKYNITSYFCKFDAAGAPTVRREKVIMLVSIVIPCYYSEKTIRKEVEMILDEFARNDGYECEFILANDGSTDGTFDEIKKLASNPNASVSYNTPGAR